ncbi:TrkH family potassium uptake protein [Calothrix sp. CCY 0018]|uniref:TrkH family potassium uptake protein n=1 Tax=Calothrix sp. CCY 0018 TaxID=3103864 RepID=UPI0039C6B213
MTASQKICFGFVAVITVGTFLLMMPFSTATGTWNSPIVAFFTATSAVCVTGLAVADTGTYFSFWGQLFIMLLAQVGGLGYMTFTTFLIMLTGRRFDLRHKIAIQQALDRRQMEGSGNIIRSIIAVTLFFEITGIFLLLIVFVPDFGWDKGMWLAIFHSVSAWNNAGFSLFSNSLVDYNYSALLVFTISGLVIFGGIGYQVILEIFFGLRDRLRRKQRNIVLSLDYKVAVSTSIFFLFLGTLAFFLVEVRNTETIRNLSLRSQFLAAWFQSMTTRTAGFNSIDIGAMTNAGLFITIAFMFVGASPGGTGGGMKTTTIRVLTSCTKSILQGKQEVLLYERRIAVSLILKAVGVVVGSVTAVIICTILISITDPTFDFIQILFEVVSAYATVGLSTGITGDFSIWGKLILILTMYMGRVGVLLLMSAVLGDPKPTNIHYPEENLLVG